MLYIRAIEKNEIPVGMPGGMPGGGDAYLQEIPAIRGLGRLTLTRPVTFLVGENGTGKSTLLEAVAVAFGFNPEGGSRNFSFSTAKTHSSLHAALKLHKGVPYPRDGFFLRAESFYNVATEVERLYEGEAPPPGFGGVLPHRQSHGESFLNLVMHRFRGEGLYLLDEPEAALSPSRQLSLLARMHDLVRMNSQFLIATHSPILMAYPGAEILLLDGSGAPRPVRYEDTEHYAITKAFLDCPERMLGVLFAEGE